MDICSPVEQTNISTSFTSNQIDQWIHNLIRDPYSHPRLINLHIAYLEADSYDQAHCRLD